MKKILSDIISYEKILFSLFCQILHSTILLFTIRHYTMLYHNIRQVPLRLHEFQKHQKDKRKTNW